MMSSTLSILPEELVLDELLPILPVKSVLSLGGTNRRFHELSDDEALWKLKCFQDFNFSGSQTSRTSGWKFIYKGLSNPKVYVWGYVVESIVSFLCLVLTVIGIISDESRGRLGIARSRSKYGGIPYPIRLQFPKKVTIVELIAGGWLVSTKSCLIRHF